MILALMEKTYEPSTIEAHWLKFWEEQQLAKPSGTGTPYCIMMPPPNVTGSLHMGHGFQQTLMDALIRYHRMLGDNTLWQAGTDHAGIATQMVVERRLEALGQRRLGLGREAFVKKVWEWKEESGSTITQQIRRLGASVDWERERFTMDEPFSKATLEAFIRLYREGLIYRGQRLVNWDPKLKTAVSDLEVVSEEALGKLYYIRYPLVNGTGHLTIATSRPETLFGDVAVAVHPDDERFKSLIGQMLELPLNNRQIPIIADDSIAMDFGTGCVKITPAHDFNDYEMGLRHQLPMINILTEEAHLNDQVPEAYRGLERYEARKKAVAELEQLGLFEKVENYQTKIPRSSRSDVVVEPLLTYQWFVKAKVLAEPALKVVKEGKLKFIPENWENTYFAWLENIQDWCISRQLWWGHRIPAWFDADKNIYVGHTEAEVREYYQLDPSFSLEQETDVLDTWFSAALWPSATLGWPEQTPDLKTFYPGSVLITGFDIIFFWVARMVMFGLKFMDDIPFKEVYITGLIRDSHGQKMSKSKGNVLDPLDLIDGISLDDLLAKRCSNLMQPEMRESIEENTRQEFPQGIKACGTDALRFSFCALANTGRDINFNFELTESYRNFCTKIWNATRFVLMHTENQNLNNNPLEFSLADRWIKSVLQTTVQKVHQHFKEYRFDLLAQSLHEFIWYEYCDCYLEYSKVTLSSSESTPAQLAGTRRTLVEVLETILRLLHPVMPFISEEIWQTLAPMLEIKGSSIMLQPYPLYDEAQRDTQAEAAIQWAKWVTIDVNQRRGVMNIPRSLKLDLYLLKRDTQDELNLKQCKAFILKLAGLNQAEIISKADFNNLQSISKTTVTSYSTIKELGGYSTAVQVPVNKEEEIERLKKQIEKLSIEQKKYDSKLSNEAFVSKAPPAVVEADRKLLQEMNESLGKLRAALAHIQP